MAIIVSHNNPIAPATAPSADEILNSYQIHAQAIRGELQQSSGDGYNPYAIKQDSQQDAQQAHLSNMQQFISPIGIDKQKPENFTDKHQETIENNLQKDPAFHEVAPMLEQHLQILKGAVDSGKMSLEDARSTFLSYGSNVIDPILEKHHGKHSDTHHTSYLDEEEVQEELPDIVKKVKGAK